MEVWPNLGFYDDMHVMIQCHCDLPKRFLKKSSPQGNPRNFSSHLTVDKVWMPIMISVAWLLKVLPGLRFYIALF